MWYGGRSLCDPSQCGWAAKFALVAAAAGLLTLAFAPFYQFYLAWAALVPLLLVAGRAASIRSAFAWGWLGGILFFTANIWWMWKASIPGTVAVVLVSAFYWAVPAAVLRTTRLIDGHPLGWTGRSRAARTIAALLLIPAVWVAGEWLRANLIRGLPWAFVGCTQTPLVSMCQVADLGGAYAVSYWVALVNAALVLSLTVGWRAMRLAWGVTVLVLLAVLAYGGLRLTESAGETGPEIMVVQTNHPHLHGGARSVSREAAVEDFLQLTERGLESASPDLIVWSEAAMPPLNPEARERLAQAATGPFLARTHARLAELAAQAGASLLTGGYYVGGWQYDGRTHVATQISNSAFLYGPDGRQHEAHYDKIQLAPFSEIMPAWTSHRWLRPILLWLAAPSAAQPLAPGSLEDVTIFKLPPAPSAEAGAPQGPAAGLRFATPICLENVDPVTVRALVRAPDGGKRADFLVDLSNDGWFAAQEHWQHLQMVVLRTIEHRLPMARSVNTGPSGFIDSRGRVGPALPPFTSGTVTSRITIDSRTTVYTRAGDTFAMMCVLLTGLLVAAAGAARLGRKGTGLFRAAADNRVHGAKS